MPCSCSSIGTGSKHVARRGFTLVQIIALVAIIAIFAVTLLRALIREIDARYVRQERAALTTYSEALQRGIMRNGYIPDQTGWTTTVASETGADLGSIAQNSRHQPRILLIDPGDLFAPGVIPGGLPYTQGNGGIVWLNPSASRPSRARFILASSVGSRALGVSPGLMSTNDFATLWNTAPGASPAIAALAGFPPADLALERIDLSPHILLLSLTTDSVVQSQEGQYSIGTNTTLHFVDNQFRLFLENTVVRLYHSQDYLSPSALDSEHVLIRGAGFQYLGHVWMSSSAEGPVYYGLDLATAARQFLTCVPNLNAPANQQKVILQDMITFMRDYVAWKESGNWQNNSYYSQVLSDQQTMMLQLQNIFMKNINRYPMNSVAPCQ
jgi:type II secretory pathway pseudopilin PulG